MSRARKTAAEEWRSADVEWRACVYPMLLDKAAELDDAYPDLAEIARIAVRVLKEAER